MILIDLEPYLNKSTSAYTSESDWVRNIRRWLIDNCGDYGIGWEWKLSGRLLSGVYLQNPEDVLAFKLKFGI